MPMTEALKMILSLAAEDVKRQVTLVDISRASFSSEVNRKVFVELPPEAGYGQQYVGELVKCVYGMRGSSQGWERTCCTVLEGMGVRRGAATPCVFSHCTRHVSLTANGDDFFAEAMPADFVWFETELLKKFEGKVK